MSENTTSVVTNSSTKVNLADIKAKELHLAEQLCRRSYPNLTIKEGSMVQDIDHPTFKNKRRVTVICPCGVEVERATSDLFTFKGCPTCKKAISKIAKAEKKLMKLEAQVASSTPSSEEE